MIPPIQIQSQRYRIFSCFPFIPYFYIPSPTARALVSSNFGIFTLLFYPRAHKYFQNLLILKYTQTSKKKKKKLEVTQVTLSLLGALLRPLSYHVAKANLILSPGRAGPKPPGQQKVKEKLHIFLS